MFFSFKKIVLVKHVNSFQIWQLFVVKKFIIQNWALLRYSKDKTFFDTKFGQNVPYTE